jgi:hypothetical protein
VTATQTVTAPAAGTRTVGQQRFDVRVRPLPGGSRHAAGRYRISGPTDSYGCYWERDRNDSGDFDAIIANDNVDGPSSVTVNKGEFVKFSGSCTWTLIR